MAPVCYRSIRMTLAAPHRMQRHLWRCAVLGAAFSLLVPLAASAARISVVGDAASLTAGEEGKLRILLDPEGEEINAVEGEVRFAPAIALHGVDTAASVVRLWLEDPSRAAPRLRREREAASVAFAGIIPGGFSGARRPFGKGPGAGELFALSVRAPAPGTYRVSFDKVRVLRHDGKGTPAAVAAGDMTLVVRAHPAASPEGLAHTPLFFIALAVVGLLSFLYLLWRALHQRAAAGKR